MKSSFKPSTRLNPGKSSKQPAQSKLNDSNAEVDSKNSSVRQSNSSFRKKNPGDSFDSGKRPALPKFGKGRVDSKAKKVDNQSTEQLSNILPPQIQNSTASETTGAGPTATVTNVIMILQFQWFLIWHSSN